MIIGESNITICFRTAFTLKDSLLKAGFKGKETKKYPLSQHTLAIYTHIYRFIYLYMVKRNGLRPAALPGMLGVVVSQQMRSRRFQSTDLKRSFFNKASQVLRNL